MKVERIKKEKESLLYTTYVVSIPVYTVLLYDSDIDRVDRRIYKRNFLNSVSHNFKKFIGENKEMFKLI